MSPDKSSSGFIFFADYSLCDPNIRVYNYYVHNYTKFPVLYLFYYTDHFRNIELLQHKSEKLILRTKWTSLSTH